MSALNKTETEALSQAERVLTTIGTFLKRLDEGEPPEDGEVKWLQREVKTVFDGVRMVKTMKGHYPN